MIVSVCLQLLVHFGPHASTGLRQSRIFQSQLGCLEPVDEGTRSNITIPHCLGFIRCRQLIFSRYFYGYLIRGFTTPVAENCDMGQYRRGDSLCVSFS